MSVPFSDERLGTSFREAVVVIEALECVTFDDADKETVRLDTLHYLKKKLWELYPYDCEDYYYANPGNGDGAVRPDSGD